jgi:hypothetical protein
MSQHVTETINLVQQQIQNLQRELSEKQRMVNSLCDLIGQTRLYADTSVSSGLRALRSDQYYGQPLATAIRMVLERRQAAGQGPATVSDIYDDLVAGGYLFNAKSDENAKRGVYGTLSKSSGAFHKLPNGDYGLLEWYPDIKEARAARRAKNGANGDDGELEDMDAKEEALSDSEIESAVEAAVSSAPKK